MRMSRQTAYLSSTAPAVAADLVSIQRFSIASLRALLKAAWPVGQKP